MKAIIMAGGKGTRLMPLTSSMPKPLMPILDKPILHYILQLLKKYGITEVAMTLGYMSDRIIETFGRGETLGMNISYYRENEPLGTAGGVKNASDFLDEDFVVISGDAFTNMDLGKLINYHYTHSGSITIASKEVDNPSLYGVMICDTKGQVLEFVEKPKNPSSNLVNTGIYVMSRHILEDIPKGFVDFAKDIFPNMLGQIYSLKCDCYWSDIGTLPSYYATNYYVAKNLEEQGVM